MALLFRPYCTHLHSVMLDNTIILRKPPASTKLPLTLHQFLLEKKKIDNNPRENLRFFCPAPVDWKCYQVFRRPVHNHLDQVMVYTSDPTAEEVIKRAQKTWQQRISKRCWETEKCWIKAQGQKKRA